MTVLTRRAQFNELVMHEMNLYLFSKPFWVIKNLKKDFVRSS